MIPEERLSSTPVPASFLDTIFTGNPLIDIEYGGVALNDASHGIQLKPWTLRYDESTGDMLVGAADVPEVVLFNRSGITQVSLAFDRNMSPVVCFVQSGQAKMYYYDDQVTEFIFQENLLGSAIDPRCTHDDKRSTQSSVSDVIVAYVKDGSLCYRQQRDRYLTERLLTTGVERLYHVGMNTKFRLQFLCKTASGNEDWTLPALIEDLCARANLHQDRINLRLMDWQKIVRGYTIGSSYSCAGVLQTLSSVFFFDPASANGMVSFVPRGRDAVSTILEDDMIDDGDDAEIEDSQSRRQDSIGIPRVLHLNYYDVAGGLNTDKQRSERPEGTRAEGEQSLQTPVVLAADEAASIVKIAHGLMVEQQKGELSFALPDNWLHITESDPVFVQVNNKMVRAIVTRAEVDDGEQRYKAIRDRQSLYTTHVQGIPAAPVTRPPSSVAGPTLVEFLDIPILRDSHDQLGFYMAVSGILPAWPGASVELSLDGGATYLESQSTRTASVIGSLVSALGDHPHEFPDEINTCQVELDTPNALLENTTLAGMLNRRNLAIIGDEIVNFATADEATDGTWELSYFLRGRKHTEAQTHAIGERFVLLDTAMFIPADLAWINRTLTFRATTIGRPVDEATIINVTFDGASQTEFAPAYLQARRDGANVVASWQGVGRLGSGAHVAMGAYFSGYRITLTDGTTTQAFDQVAASINTSLSAFTGSVTVRVQQLNQITGLGPSIEVII